MSLDEPSATGDKGLKEGALGFVSSVVIGVSSTAPGYSLASALGLVTLSVGLQAPAIMLVAFVPMLFIAAAYYYLNRADPDCGTTFSWVTRAMGPYWGWMGGWGILAADIIVMANLAQIAGLYTFELFGADHYANSTFWVTVVGVLWIVIMTFICYVGIEVSAKVQWGLLSAEIVILGLFAVVALYQVYFGNAPGSIHPSLSWINPLDISSWGALSAGLITAIFIYWGWDSTVAVNEETEDAAHTPGKAAVASTIILVGIYLVDSIAAQSVHGAELPDQNSDDVFSALAHDVLGSPLDKLRDPRRSHLRVRGHADDDPADRADIPVDGGARGDPEDVREDPPALSHAVHVHALDGRPVDRVVHRDDQDQPERARRVDLGAGIDDRLLLRAHGHRLSDLLPAAPDERASRTS